jgi:D-amino-acid dehydrogenase
MERGRSADVLVLGGGVIGLACALALLREGRSVTVLERGAVGQGASHGNCGTLTPSLLPLPAPGVIRQALRWMASADSPLLIRPRLDPQLIGWLLRFAGRCNRKSFRAALAVKLPLLLRARALTEQWIHHEKLDCEFSASGHLQVFRSEAALARAVEATSLAREFGLVTEVLDGGRARALEPALNDTVIGALMNPGDAQLRPDRYLAELARTVRAAGGEIAEGTAVTGFEQR